MPSPYAHLIAGITIATPYLSTKAKALRHKEDIATLIGFSLLPDLDVIPGLMLGDIAAHHNQFTHSMAFGLSVCLLYSIIRRVAPAPRSFGRTFTLSATAYGLHLLMDFLNYGRGLMLFWPFTEQRYAPPVLLFYGLRRSDGWLSPDHLITFATESLTLLPILGVVWFIARRQRQKQ